MDEEGSWTVSKKYRDALEVLVAESHERHLDAYDGDTHPQGGCTDCRELFHSGLGLMESVANEARENFSEMITSITDEVILSLQDQTDIVKLKAERDSITETLREMDLRSTVSVQPRDPVYGTLRRRLKIIKEKIEELEANS